MEGRWAVRFWRSARAAVEDLVDLASPNHGIVPADACVASGNCWPAVWQVATGSRFLRALNSGSETPGAVSYSQIYSTTDELVQPSSTERLAPARNSADVAVQDVCPGRVLNHAGILGDAVVDRLVLDAMTHPGPAAAARVPATACLEAFMPGVTAADVAAGQALLYGNAVAAFASHDGVTAEPPLKPYAAG
jgi:hypothetical protein